ncbi:MAG TPA: DUF2868 domain-containing protein [Methylomirabilota bacterium]|jgi:hypothetical protein
MRDGTLHLRLSEPDARTLLLVQAAEEVDADGLLLSPPTRASATRRAFDDPAQVDDPGRLRTRAELLRKELVREVPDLRRVLEPPAWRGTTMLLVLAVGVVVGAATNAFGPSHHVSVLAFPLATILGWNLLAYGAFVLGGIARLRGGRPAASRLAALGRWLEGLRLSRLATRLGASARSGVVADAVQRFQRLWIPTAAALIAARVRMILHAGAFALALGAVAGMYVSGVAFEYRATWESTWLDAPDVQRYVDIVLGPASRVLGIPVPDVAPLRAPGEGDARPWIHLWAATLGLGVLLPRAALAAAEALTSARLSRRLPVAVDAGYARRALHSGRGAATVVEVVYYSCAPTAALRDKLHTILQEHAGARAVIRDGASLEYGDEPGQIALSDPAPGVVALVFTLAQTPEPEVHGKFIERLRERLDAAGRELVLVLESATYRDRVGSEDRVRERRATWERLLRSVQVAAVDLA